MTDTPDQMPGEAGRKITLRSLPQILRGRNGVLVLIILLLILISVVVWQLNIDWEEEVKRYGYPGVFLLMFASSLTIFLPLPSEAILAVTPNIMGLEGFWAISTLGLVASIGAALGEMTSYFAGYWGRAVVADKYQEGYEKVQRWMTKYGGVAIFIFSFTPLPFDLVGIASGSLRYPLWKFLFFCWVGRLARALLIVHLGKVGWAIFTG